jgi:hypothetical protein
VFLYDFRAGWACCLSFAVTPPTTTPKTGHIQSVRPDLARALACLSSAAAGGRGKAGQSPDGLMTTAARGRPINEQQSPVDYRFQPF